MNISGVLVRSYPDNIDTVRTTLEQLSGVEVHGANPDGRLVVTASSDQTACVFDRKTRRQITEALKHDAAVNCARFSPALLCSQSNDGRDRRIPVGATRSKRFSHYVNWNLGDIDTYVIWFRIISISAH